MNLYKIGYTLFEIYARCTYVYAMNKESAITVFKMSAADLGLEDTDYTVDWVLTKNHIEESIVMQGVYHEEGKD